MEKTTWTWECDATAEGRPAVGVCEVIVQPLTAGDVCMIVQGQGFGYMLDTPHEQDERVQLYWWNRTFPAHEDMDQALEVVFTKRDLAWKIVQRRSSKVPQLARIKRKANRRYFRMKGFEEKKPKWFVPKFP